MKPYQMALEDALAGKYFQCMVDLGCGFGRWGFLLKKHADWLIGVDADEESLKMAMGTGYYNGVVKSDIREYEFPRGTDAVVMLEVIEHIPKSDGLRLLERMEGIPFVLITTPIKYVEMTLTNGPHVSYWSEEELRNLGFKTERISGGVSDIIYGGSTLAVKEWI